MNEIEKNDIKDKDRALDYLIPSTTPLPLIPLMKSRMLALTNEQIIINKANLIYYRDHIVPYLEFFLKFLDLAGEHARIMEIDNGAITIARLSYIANSNKSPLQAIPDTSNEIWLYIHAIKNQRLSDYLVNCWQITNKYIAKAVSENDESNVRHSVYIQLYPAVTCSHLDTLYQAMCSYL